MFWENTARSSQRRGAAGAIVPMSFASAQRMRAEAEQRRRFDHYIPKGTVQGDSSPCGHQTLSALSGEAKDFLVETILFDRLSVGLLRPTSLHCAGLRASLGKAAHSQHTVAPAAKSIASESIRHIFTRQMCVFFAFSKAQCQHLFGYYYSYLPTLISRSAGWEPYGALQ